VAEKLQMAEVTVGIWPAGATTGLPRCGFSWDFWWLKRLDNGNVFNS
jgi:hypothetical protein